MYADMVKVLALQHAITKTLARCLRVQQPNEDGFVGGLRHANDHGQAHSGGSE